MIIVIMLSMFLWMSLHRSPHQLLCVLVTLLCIHVSNQTSRRRRLTYLAARFATLRPILLESFPLNGLLWTVSLMGEPMKSFGSSQFFTCVSPIHKLL